MKLKLAYHDNIISNLGYCENRTLSFSKQCCSFASNVIGHLNHANICDTICFQFCKDWHETHYRTIRENDVVSASNPQHCKNRAFGIVLLN